MARPFTVDREKVFRLFESGWSRKSIAQELQCSITTEWFNRVIRLHPDVLRESSWRYGYYIEAMFAHFEGFYQLGGSDDGN